MSRQANPTDVDVFYKGMRDPEVPGTECVIKQQSDKNPVILDPSPSQKIWNHSPDGFNWGYGGSGPAQLALALLLDATGDPGTALTQHQNFKRCFVCDWGDAWVLTQKNIIAWLNSLDKNPGDELERAIKS